MCNCQRTTYLCLCSHKERSTDRCFVYQLRKQGSYWACCFPKCRTHTRRYHLQRVCRDCENYFLRKYGEHHYKKFIDYFLEYKERNGWATTVIDPRSVPRTVLLKRQSAPAHIAGSEIIRQWNRDPFPAHQPMVASRSARQVSHHSRLMVLQQQEAQRQTTRVNEQPASQDLQQAPVDQRVAPSSQERPLTPFPHNSTPSPVGTLNKVDLALALPPGAGFFSDVPAPLYVPSKDKILPTDPSLFAVGDDDSNSDDEEGDGNISSEEDDIDGVRGFTPSPLSEYNSDNLPAESRIPELAHLAQGEQPPLTRRHSLPKIQQPVPRTLKNKKPVIRNPESVSDISVVKKLTKVAEDLHVPNVEYVDYDGKWVPRVMTPPKGKRKTRTPTPSPRPTGPSGRSSGPYNHNSMTAINVTIAENAVTESFIPDKDTAKAVKQERSPSTYFVQPQPRSATVPPPKRPDGILVPASAPQKGGKSTDGQFFKEIGLPPKQYIQGCRSATLEQTTPVLVHAPQRRYSVAVQSCFCDDQMKASKCVEDKCLSCRERDLIAQDMNTTWI